MSLDKLEQVDVNVDPGEDEPSHTVREDVATVDILLHNSGGTPALVTEVSFTFVRAEAMRECVGLGGPVLVSALYDIQVPADVSAAPFTRSEKITFSVNPNEYDRLAITVGPENIPETALPYLYSIDVALITSGNNEPIDAGRVAIATPISHVDSAIINGQRALGLERTDVDGGPLCVRENFERLQTALDSSEKRSPELLRLHDRYTVLNSFISDRDSDTGPLGNLDWTSPALADPNCSELGLDPRSGPTVYADLTNDGVKDALVTFSCETSTGGYPEYVQLFDGASPTGRPRALADLPLDPSKV
ncbi:hypothetical protein [Geodermatophilus sp. URMC 62]|uniref:hypothetical protein n=1 Tax=Geodermatophilus sp. URMC 62 TaxID=3423414 RepID=UPI00406C7DA3